MTPYEQNYRVPGRFEEHPMPDDITTFSDLIFRRARAVCTPRKTAKSPQPGHQVGVASVLYASSLTGSTTN